MKNSVFHNLGGKFVDWLEKYLPNCEHTTILADRSLDKDLSVREWIDLKLHTWICAACRNYLSQIRFMRQVFREQEDPGIDPDTKLSAEARQRIKDSLRDTNR